MRKAPPIPIWDLRRSAEEDRVAVLVLVVVLMLQPKLRRRREEREERAGERRKEGWRKEEVECQEHCLKKERLRRSCSWPLWLNDWPPRATTCMIMIMNVLVCCPTNSTENWELVLVVLTVDHPIPLRAVLVNHGQPLRLETGYLTNTRWYHCYHLLLHPAPPISLSEIQRRSTLGGGWCLSVALSVASYRLASTRRLVIFFIWAKVL